jgi:hypothetical protein
MKSKLLILLVLTTFIFWGCKKVKPIEDELPAITNTGANTFGCILDGKAYVPRRKCPRLTIMGNGSPCFDAWIYKYHPPYNSFTEFKIGVTYDKFINDKDVELEITAEMDTVNSKSIRVDEAYLRYANSNTTRYTLDTTKNNIFNSVINLTGKIASGTFTLYFINSTGDTKTLSNGRFDFGL